MESDLREQKKYGKWSHSRFGVILKCGGATELGRNEKRNKRDMEESLGIALDGFKYF